MKHTNVIQDTQCTMAHCTGVLDTDLSQNFNLNTYMHHADRIQQDDPTLGADTSKGVQ